MLDASRTPSDIVEHGWLRSGVLEDTSACGLEFQRNSWHPISPLEEPLKSMCLGRQENYSNIVLSYVLVQVQKQWRRVQNRKSWKKNQRQHVLTSSVPHKIILYVLFLFIFNSSGWFGDGVVRSRKRGTVTNISSTEKALFVILSFCWYS